MLERRVTLKSQRQIELMAVAGRLVADVLDRVGKMLQPGVTTLELDDVAQALIRERGGVPSFIGEPGPRSRYRHALCVSIDEQIVHGIPGKRRLAAGQIVSVDAGAIVEGWHGDGARTWVIGEVAARRPHTRGRHPRSVAGRHRRGRSPGNHMGDISARRRGRRRCGTATASCATHVGHGIGTEMHEAPQVENYRTGRPGRRLEPGLCLAIEPMFTLGSGDTRMLDDGWTIVAADGSLAAHWEHTIAITEDGPRILTTDRRSRGVLARDRHHLIQSPFVRRGLPRHGRDAHAAGRQPTAGPSTPIQHRIEEPAAACGQEGRHRGRGHGRGAFAQRHVRHRTGERPSRPGPYQRQAPHEFHPHPAGRPGPRRTLAVRPARGAGSRTA